MKCVNSISVVPETITLLEDTWFYNAYAVVSPSDAECAGVVWSSENDSIASVGEYSGYIYAKSAGTTTIYATAIDGSGVKGSCVVEVEPRTYLQSVCLSPCEMTIPIWQKDGDEEFIVALVEPFDATDTSVVWSSSNSNVVEVQKRTPAINTKNGLAAVFGRSTGTATITATANDGSGRKSTCTVTVVPYIPVGKITMDRSTYTMEIGNYAYLCCEICPSNATNQEVRWSSSNSSVVEVSSVGRITAKSWGVATITATAIDGSGISTKCIVTVKKKKVILEKDIDGTSRIVFDNGVVWNCANRDLINDYQLSRDDEFSRRFYENVYTDIFYDEGSNHWFIQPPLKHYSDEEIKLIYTIDPYGLATYINIYAREEFKGSNNTDENESYSETVLKDMLDYKDSIFYLLFNRQPKYYARNTMGDWYETTKGSNLLSIVSESEFLFGHHTVYDAVTARAFFELVIDVVSIAIGCLPLGGIIGVALLNTIETVQEYYSLARCVEETLLREDINVYINYVAEDYVDGVVETVFDGFSLGWAYDLLSLGNTVGDLADSFNNYPNYYKEVFTYCDTDLDYDIMIKTTDNKLISVSDINSLVE